MRARLPVHAPLTFGYCNIYRVCCGCVRKPMGRDKLVIVTNRYLFGTYDRRRASRFRWKRLKTSKYKKTVSRQMGEGGVRSEKQTAHARFYDPITRSPLSANSSLLYGSWRLYSILHERNAQGKKKGFSCSFGPPFLPRLPRLPQESIKRWGETNTERAGGRIKRDLCCSPPADIPHCVRGNLSKRSDKHKENKVVSFDVDRN